MQLSNSNPNRSHHQTRAQRKRVAAEKEEQRSECALTFEKSRSKRYKACSDVVPVTGQPCAARFGTHSTSQKRGAGARIFGTSWVEPPVRAQSRPISKKQHPKRGAAFLVPVTGLEPVRCRQRWILSPLRLPIPSHRRGDLVIISHGARKFKGEFADTFGAKKRCKGVPNRRKMWYDNEVPLSQYGREECA